MSNPVPPEKLPSQAVLGGQGWVCDASTPPDRYPQYVLDVELPPAVNAAVAAAFAAFTGQPTIVTVGTITTGQWNANVIQVAYGGTGLSVLTTGSYLRALNANSFEQRTPAQMRGDLGVTTNSDGTYTPTATGVVNVTSTSVNVAQWMRVGDTVTVSGNLTVTATAAGDTQLRLTLPVPSNFAATGQCSGSGADRSGTYPNVAISADITNDQALLQFTASGAGARAVQYHFTYRVLPP